jgi:hypothetical protein
MPVRTTVAVAIADPAHPHSTIELVCRSGFPAHHLFTEPLLIVESLPSMAATNKYLARSNKSHAGSKATKKRKICLRNRD